MFKAPDGTPIKGELQEDGGVWRVTFTDPSDVTQFAYDDDGPDSAWSAVMIDGEAIFEDEKGKWWFQHHLLADYAEDENGDEIDPVPLPDEGGVEFAIAEVENRRRAHQADGLAALLPEGGPERLQIEQWAAGWRANAQAFRSMFDGVAGRE